MAFLSRLLASFCTPAISERGNSCSVAMNEVTLSVRILFYLFFKNRQRFSRGGIVLPRLVWEWILPICSRCRVRYLFQLLGLARKPPFSLCRKPSPTAAAANINPRRNSPRSVPTLFSSSFLFSSPPSSPHSRARLSSYPLWIERTQFMALVPYLLHAFG